MPTDEPPARGRLARAVRAATPLDWIRLALLAAGIVCVLTGALPRAEAEANLRRIAPLLAFLAAIIVLAKLTKEARVFDVLAARMAIAGRGSYPALFGLSVLLASSLTMFLNLDTTAVLLTPVLLALAAQTGIAAPPLAMTTVWLANTASLLLPVSNLTNLLAADRVALPPAAFAARMWLPQLVAVAVTALFLWLFFWRRKARGKDAYVPPAPPAIDSPKRFWAASIACLGFVIALFAGVEIAIAAGVAAAVVVAAFAVNGGRAHLRPSLIPWQLLIFVTGLFLVVPTLARHGLADVMAALIGSDGGLIGAFRAAFTGAGLSNALNNLPAYTAGETVVPAQNQTQLLALLIGTNVGPVVTMWGSLATLLWYESCRIYGVRVEKRRFALTGAVCALIAIAGSVPALLVTGQ
ncbi:SLC13 family permease [Actinorhabdospora filicis]|uniref:SLC13 family permease n=1 Tax=Actinorhabdospora filicis TaxID=1785913 RepID=UPI002555820B|nr:SLC13 family permease [Actinorhabdospora filicis]